MSRNNKIASTIVLLIIIHLTVLILYNQAIPLKNLLYKSFSSQMTNNRIIKLIELQSKMAWLNYVLTVLISLLRIGLTVLCIKIGEFFFNYKIKNYSPIIIMCESTVIVTNIATLTWITFNLEHVSLTNITAFTPLALINLFDISIINQIFHYPLRIINVFEISFWFILAYIVSRELKIKYWKSFEFVMSTYGVGLLIWVVFVMFLTIHMS